MMTFFLIGAVCGLCSSAPLGPINLWLTEGVLQGRSKRAIRPFIAGVILTDLCFAYLASIGYYKFERDDVFAPALSVVGGAFLIILGMINLRALFRNKDKKESCKRQERNRELHGGQSFLLGVFFCGSNPAFLIFWLAAFDWIFKITKTPISNSLLLAFLLGIGTGDLLWFKLLTSLAAFGEKRIGENRISSIRVAISIIFIVAGTYMIGKYN